jgi:hypothetical protein
VRLTEADEVEVWPVISGGCDVPALNSVGKRA